MKYIVDYGSIHLEDPKVIETWRDFHRDFHEHSGGGVTGHTSHVEEEEWSEEKYQ